MSARTFIALRPRLRAGPLRAAVLALLLAPSAGAAEMENSIRGSAPSRPASGPALPAETPGEPWWDARWPYRMRFSVDGEGLTDSLAEFPVLVQLSSATPALGRLREDGGDIRFVAADGRTELDFEVERVSRREAANSIRGSAPSRPASGPALPAEAAVWVSFPRLMPGDGANEFFLYYGNPEARLEGRGRNPERVWNRYNAVFHFSEFGGVTFDSTGRGNDLKVEAFAGEEGKGRGTAPSLADFVTPLADGAVGGAIRFTGKDCFAVPSAGVARGMGERGTIELMARPAAQGPEQGVIFAAQSDDDKRGLRLGLQAAGFAMDTVHEGAWSGLLASPGLTRNLRGAWHSVSALAAVAGKARRIVVDGRESVLDRRLMGRMGFDKMRLGNGFFLKDRAQFVGDIDELRFSSSTLSPEWLRASGRNLSGPGRFVAAGREQALGEPAPAPSAFHLDSPPSGSVCVRRASPVLRWGPSAGALSYRVVMSKRADLSSPVWTPRVAGRQVPVHGFELDPGTTWYWTVFALGPGGETRAAETASLRVYDWEDAQARPPSLAVRPVFERMPGASLRLGGVVGERVAANLERWLLAAPGRNPAMLQMLRDRDRHPPRELVSWAGEFVGKYLVSAVKGYRLTGDARLGKLLEGLFAELLEAQASDGYLGPFPKGERLVGANWDVWGHSHVLLALLEYHGLTGRQEHLDAASRAADLLFETFRDDPGLMTSDYGRGQMNTAVIYPLLRLYELTGRARYLELAERITRAWDEPGGAGFLRGARDRVSPSKFPARRWESLHGFQGIGELYLIRGKKTLLDAFNHIWRGLAAGDRHNTGALTTDEEFVGSPYGPGTIETCGTAGWIALTVDRNLLSGDSRAADELEWSTLNAALGSQDPEGGHWTFDTPMDGVKKYGQGLAWQAPDGGPDLNCCAVHGPRSIGAIADWALLRDGRRGVVVNYYGPSEATVPVEGVGTLRLRQETRYPLDGRVRLRVSPPRPARLPVKLRIPRWSRRTKVSVNGAAAGPASPGTYLELDRQWREGDVVDVEFDFSLRHLSGRREVAGKASVFRGPLLLAYDQRFNSLAPEELPALDMKALEERPAKTNLTPAPWLLVSVKGVDGREVVLCDFASAGTAGNVYNTWLPAVRTSPPEFWLQAPYPGDRIKRGKAPFRWSPAEGAKRYEIAVSSRPDTRGPAWRGGGSVSEQPRLKMDLAPGRWFWTVYAENDDGRVEASNGPSPFIIEP
ncbi:MAG: glycoside hydrolase family 127 protein [Elusimicrobia bacterium]|nr:glycoside hydrolase family 127 protein [Elusimicrobiota bacterium]